jgi:hypothetical protein
VPPNCHFNQLGVPPNIFKDLKGAANQKRLKNTEARAYNKVRLGKVRLAGLISQNVVNFNTQNTDETKRQMSAFKKGRIKR